MKFHFFFFFISIQSGIIIFFIELQPEKASISIKLTDGGIEICFNEVHPLKATRSVEVNEEGNDTSFKAGHFLKASSLMEVTEEGIDNERDLLFLVIKRGRETFSSDEQLVKVKTPIDFTY